MRMVNDDRICIGYVQTCLNNCCCYQNIFFAIDEIQHNIFQLVTVKLAMGYTNSCFRYKSLDQASELWKVIYPVVDEKDLAVTVKFILNSLLYKLIIKNVELGIYSLTIGRGGAHDG